ncbi:MAG: pilus assembly protein PilM [Phycisphaerae bacterium]|jgi:Tfp pilus assembly protein PilN
MIKRCIGIDIGSSHLRAVQILRKGEEFHIEKALRVPTRRDTDSPADIIRSLVKQHDFDHHADVAISMPHDAVFFRNLETDSAGAERIRSLDSSTLENDFPIQPDEIIAQVCSYRQLPDGKYSALTAAVSKKILYERLSLLAGAKLRPVLADAAIFAVHSTVAINHPDVTTGRAIIAHANESCLTLAVTEDNNILIVRNIPIIAPADSNTDLIQTRFAEILLNEAKTTWRKTFGEEIGQNTKIYLVSEDRVFSDIEALVEKNLHCQIIIVDPYARVKGSVDSREGLGISVAQGLALRVLAPEAAAGINFLDADNVDVKSALNPRKEFAIFAALVAAIIIVSLIGLFVRLSLLETKYNQIRNEIAAIFQQVLPEEKNIVNPLAQLEQKLQSLQKDYALLGSASGAGIGPVEVLYAISKNIPSQVNVKIDNMLITAGFARLTGTSQSFESVYTWQKLLQETPLFSTVDVQDIRRSPESGLVNFTILAQLSAPERK